MQLKISSECSEGRQKCFWSSALWMQPTPAHPTSLRLILTLTSIMPRYFKMASYLERSSTEISCAFHFEMKLERGQYSMLNGIQNTVMIGWQHRRKTCGSGVNVNISSLERQQPLLYSVTQYRLYQGVLYFQMIIQFHGTRVNVISFTPITKVQPSLRQFWWN